MSDTIYMQEALTLALKGLGCVSPNPLVGAVIVKNGKILARGYHHRYGAAHAEIDALRKIGFKARGATLYCNLEPCCHQGHTPPCVDRVIASGIKRVVIAQKDPNPQVNGRSLRLLRQKGIEVKLGVLRRQARYLNRIFNCFHEKKRPYVLLKAALSGDGRIAPLRQKKGERLVITGPAAHRRVHLLRSQVDAVLVGSRTVLLDDPRLNARGAGVGRQPKRIILDAGLKTQPGSRIFSKKGGGQVYVVSASKPSPKKVCSLEAKGAQILAAKSRKGRIDLKDLLARLASLGVSSLLIEGGGRVWDSFIQAGFVDEAVFFVNSRKLGVRFRKAPDFQKMNGFLLTETLIHTNQSQASSFDGELHEDAELHYIKCHPY